MEDERKKGEQQKKGGRGRGGERNIRNNVHKHGWTNIILPATPNSRYLDFHENSADAAEHNFADDLTLKKSQYVRAYVPYSTTLKVTTIENQDPQK